MVRRRQHGDKIQVTGTRTNAKDVIRGVNSALAHHGMCSCKLDTLVGWKAGAGLSAASILGQRRRNRS